jgi:hypothetical protein
VVGKPPAPRRPWHLYAAGLLALLLILRVLRRPRGRPRIGQPPPGVSNETLKLVVVVLAGLLIAVSVALYRARAELYDLKLIDMLHHATFKDFGDPPRPLHPPVSPRLSASYWRGNDERNPKLYNGGNYLTSTFHTSVRTDQGEDLDHGSDVGGRKLWVRLEMERAPNTAPFFYSDEIMNSIVISKESGYFLGSERQPIPDVVKLKTLEKMQRWEALYPIGAVPPEGAWRTRGVVYVYQLVQVPETGEVLGARYHYGLEYEVSTKDGVVQPESDLWMGFFYRTRKSGVNKVPPREWFSHEPIPPMGVVLPRAHPADPRWRRGHGPLAAGDRRLRRGARGLARGAEHVVEGPALALQGRIPRVAQVLGQVAELDPDHPGACELGPLDEVASDGPGQAAVGGLAEAHLGVEDVQGRERLEVAVEVATTDRQVVVGLLQGVHRVHGGGEAESRGPRPVGPALRLVDPPVRNRGSSSGGHRRVRYRDGSVRDPELPSGLALEATLGVAQVRGVRGVAEERLHGVGDRLQALPSGRPLLRDQDAGVDHDPGHGELQLRVTGVGGGGPAQGPGDGDDPGVVPAGHQQQEAGSAEALAEGLHRHLGRLPTFEEGEDLVDDLGDLLRAVPLLDALAHPLEEAAPGDQGLLLDLRDVGQGAELPHPGRGLQDGVAVVPREVQDEGARQRAGP